MRHTLEELFFKHEGNQVDKWEQYLKIYDIELARFAQLQEPISLLEIGVQNGGSLELWGSYLPKGSTIHGVDIDPRVGEVQLSDQNIHIHILDGTSDEMMTLFSEHSFDIIIDDGSHLSSDIVRSFKKCFQLVKPGGLYIIEDLHASYFKSHGGGLHEKNSAINFLKTLVDSLHLDYIDDATCLSEYPSVMRQCNALIGRITFYDSVAVIEKIVRPKLEPYRRILSGINHAAVDSNRWLDALPHDQLASLCVSPKTSERIDHRLIDKIEELDNIRSISEKQNVDLQFRVRELESQLHNLNEERTHLFESDIARLKEIISAKDIFIEETKSSAAQAQVAHARLLKQEIERSSDQLDRERKYSAQIKSDLEKLEISEKDHMKRYDVLCKEIELAKSETTRLMSLLERERTEAAFVIQELSGKIDRAYAAWNSKKLALDRLKQARKPY